MLALHVLGRDDGASGLGPRSPSLAEPSPVPAAAPHPALRATLSPAKKRGRGSPCLTLCRVFEMRRSEQPWKTNRARVLRDGETSAEDALWQRLRERRLGDFKFVRQLPIGPYFGDLVCRELKVIVEIDGATHFTDDELLKDAERTAKLEALGYRINRVTNTDVYHNMRGVLDGLLHLLRGPATATDQPLSPAAGGGEGAPLGAGEGQPLAQTVVARDDGASRCGPQSPSPAEPRPVPAAAPHPALRATLSSAQRRGRGKDSP